EELEAAIQSQLDSLTAGGPTAEEMKSTKTVIQTGLLTQIESLGALADLLNHYNQFTGDPGYLNKDLDRYQAVTAAGVKDFIASHLGKNQRVAVQVLPGEKVLPPTPPT